MASMTVESVQATIARWFDLTKDIFHQLLEVGRIRGQPSTAIPSIDLDVDLTAEACSISKSSDWFELRNVIDKDTDATFT